MVHAQRVIATQLQQIVWQPFSSEITLQDPNSDSLFKTVVDGLMESRGKSGGLRAARLWTALSMRSLQSPSPVTQSSSASKILASSRTKMFIDKVMAVLSLLVKPSLHANLRNDLSDLAESAISMWNIAQLDERELVADPTLPVEGFDGLCEDISASNNEIIVLFPRVIARSCSRAADHRSVGPPGGWIDSEPKQSVQETCIYPGAGLAKWSPLVLEGEAEEEGRKEEEDRKKREEQRKILEDDLKKLDKAEKPLTGHRRGSHTKRGSITGSQSSPSAVWMSGASQRIVDGVE